MSNLFNKEDIKVFDLKELHGKILQMIVVENEECVLILGQDIITKDIYILKQENKLIGGSLNGRSK